MECGSKHQDIGKSGRMWTERSVIQCRRRSWTNISDVLRDKKEVPYKMKGRLNKLVVRPEMLNAEKMIYNMHVADMSMLRRRQNISPEKYRK